MAIIMIHDCIWCSGYHPDLEVLQVTKDGKYTKCPVTGRYIRIKKEMKE